MHSDSPLVAGGDDYFGGQVAEYCGEFIDSDHNTILNLVKRFGLTASDVLAAQPNSSTETYYFNGGYYSYADASKDFQPVHATLQSQVHAAGYPTLWNSFNQAGSALDQLSLHDWIDQYVPGGHQSNFGRLLDSAYNEEYGADTTDQSSLNLVFLLGFKSKPGNFQIFGASDERFHIAGGNQQLPETMASYLTGTGLTTIATGSRMNTIALNSNGTVSLWFDGSKSPVVYDQVILTTSFSVLRTLDYSKAGFDALKKTAITQLGSGRNGKLQLQFDTRYWNQTGPWGLSNGDVYTDYGLQNVWDVTRAQPYAKGILVNYSGGSIAGGFKPSTPYSNASTNKQVTTYAKAFLQAARDGLPRHHAALERPGQPVHPVPRPEPALLVRVLARRAVHEVQRLRGSGAGPRGPDPLRRRALLHRLPGIHGRRRGRGRPGGEGNPRHQVAPPVGCGRAEILIRQLKRRRSSAHNTRSRRFGERSRSRRGLRPTPTAAHCSTVVRAARRGCPRHLGPGTGARQGRAVPLLDELRRERHRRHDRTARTSTGATRRRASSRAQAARSAWSSTAATSTGRTRASTPAAPARRSAARSSTGRDVNQSFISGVNSPHSLAISGGYIYWASRYGNTIGRAKLDGTGVNSNFITGAIGPWGVAVSGNYVYWTNYGANGGSDGTTVGRANINGKGANQSFITGAGAPAGIAVCRRPPVLVESGLQRVGHHDRPGRPERPGRERELHHRRGLPGGADDPRLVHLLVELRRPARHPRNDDRPREPQRVRREPEVHPRRPKPRGHHDGLAIPAASDSP